MAYNKPLKALASLAGTLTHGLRHFVPYFSPCVIALYAGVIYLGKLMKSRAEKFTHNKSIKYAPSAPDALTRAGY